MLDLNFCVKILPKAVLNGCQRCWKRAGWGLLCFLPWMVHAQAVEVGAARLPLYLPHLQDKQVGLVVNHTSLVGNRHLADTLHDQGICIARIFAPEHGFRGEADAGEGIHEAYDKRTGAVIASLYGKRRKPSADDLAGLDVVVFDIQDVGARFYTYISTMFYVMEACAEQGIAVLILDRPNPNGHLIDGPVLDTRFSSFVGIAPLPVAHGCTVGELALLFKGECWINKGDKLDLTVIPCTQYHHHTPYDLPVKPSPNLPTARSVLLYPTICLFEGTTSSVGRGTDFPFEVVGHPEFGTDSICFMPRPNAGNKSPLHQGWVCKGWDFSHISTDSLRSSTQLHLSWLLDYYQAFPNKPAFFRTDNFMDLLAGTNKLRQQIEQGLSEEVIRASWENDLEAYKAIRLRYLLYD
jgi:uncharacterized protein YbbC (DUF1343 family)